MVRAYASPECYDYDPKKPLPEQIAEPESWTDEEFCDKGVPIQRSPDLWSDLEAQYLANKGKFAYVLLRFWSDRAGRVTCALGASRCVQELFGSSNAYILIAVEFNGYTIGLRLLRAASVVGQSAGKRTCLNIGHLFCTFEHGAHTIPLEMMHQLITAVEDEELLAFSGLYKAAITP